MARFGQGLVELLAAGLPTPGGSAVVIGTMTVAAAATAPNGFWAQKGGCEVPFCYGALAAVLAFTGPGPWPADRALLPVRLDGCAWGSAALALGLAAAVPPALSVRPAVRNVGREGGSMQFGRQVPIFDNRKRGIPGGKWGKRHDGAWFARLGAFRLSGNVCRVAVHAGR